MAQDYSELATYVRTHKSDPIALAKVMVAWQWTSLFPGGYGTAPTSAASVPSVLNAQCGWRDILLQSLFDEIGIQSRRVNFHDVPFQTNHTATELLINGKWMFFDATFGIYFTKKGSSTPLSIEEARSAWPDVVVNQCSLPGWQGVFVDPETISAGAYATKTDTLAYQPEPFTRYSGIISGELDSLYFGPRATYLDDWGNSPAISSTGHTWKTLTDTPDTRNWNKIVQSFDDTGRLDTVSGLNDDRSRWFVDRDTKDKFAWREQTSYVTQNSILDYRVELYDDLAKKVIDNDQALSAGWETIESYYGVHGSVDYVLTNFDDGSTVIDGWDILDLASWTYHHDIFDTVGNILNSTVTDDEGVIRVIDWTSVPAQGGDASANSLFGTNTEDLLKGFAGDDYLDGGAGLDRLEGGAENDIYILDASDIVLERANEGADTVVAPFNYVLGANLEHLVLGSGAIYGTGNELANEIAGNELGNVLSGYAGNDQLRGLLGDDLLVGGPGNDAIQGGLGTDTLWGSAGKDTFLWQDIDEAAIGPLGADIVMDFSFASGDRINLRLIDSNELTARNEAFSFVGNAGFSAPGQLRYIQAATETQILLSTDADASAEGMIRLARHLTPDASWFIL